MKSPRRYAPMGGSFAPVRVAGFRWNGWQPSAVYAYCFYSQDLEARSKRQTSLKSLLATALIKDEFYLKYQPIYDLNDRTVQGVEAFLRWQNEELGEVSTSEFIPVAEDGGLCSASTILSGHPNCRRTGLIDQIGFWVVEQALTDLRRIDDSAGGDLFLSVNVSVKQLRDPLFPVKLDELLERYDVDSSRLKLEITESILISEHDNEHGVLMELSERGYKLALDDFGTRYSALGYLQHYPLDIIKIDKSFISEGDALGSSASLVKTIVYMAETMGMKTVAEGIETAEQEAFVRSIGCSYGQGFHFSHPERCDRIVAFIQSRQISSLS